MKAGRTAFAYVIGGEGYFCGEKDPFTYKAEGMNYFDMQRKPAIGNGSLVIFDDGERIIVATQGQEVRFLLVSGKPIGEPVAWYGPIVMNTQESCASPSMNTATARSSRCGRGRVGI